MTIGSAEVAMEQQAGIELIRAERWRQIDVEGFTAVHDDFWHRAGDLAEAGFCYYLAYTPDAPLDRTYWPWEAAWWKPGARDRNLVKSGALFLAEAARKERLGQFD